MEKNTVKAENPINVDDPKFGANNFEKLGKGASNSDLTSATALQDEMQTMQTSMQKMTPEQRTSYRVDMNNRFNQDGYNGRGLPKMEFMQDGSLSITSAQDYDYQNVGEPVKHMKGHIQFDLDGRVGGSRPGPLTTELENSLDRTRKKESNPHPEENALSGDENRTPTDGRSSEYWALTDKAATDSRNVGKHFLGKLLYGDHLDPSEMEKKFADGLAEGIKNGASAIESKPGSSSEAQTDRANPYLIEAAAYGRAIGENLKELCKSLSKVDIQALEQRLSGEFRTAMDGRPGLPLHGN